MNNTCSPKAPIGTKYRPVRREVRDDNRTYCGINPYHDEDACLIQRGLIGRGVGRARRRSDGAFWALGVGLFAVLAWLVLGIGPIVF